MAMQLMTGSRSIFGARISVIAMSLVLLTGCGAGPNAPTRLIKQVTDGVEKQVGDVKLIHVLLVKQPDGSAVLVGTVINNGESPDTITNLSANGIPAQILPTPLIATPEQPLIFAGESANALAVFPGLDVKPGRHASLQIALRNSGSVTVETLVRDRIGEFADVGPALAGD
jgi:hypothetical protein